METAQWMTGEVLLLQDQKREIEDLICDTTGSGDEYCGMADYRHDLEHMFNNFDECFSPAEKGIQSWQAWNRIEVKKEVPASPQHNDPAMKALPVFTRVKPEHSLACCTVATHLPVRSNQLSLSLDTSFSPTSDLGSSCSGSPTVDLDSPDSCMESGESGLEVYHDLIMRHLIQDVQTTCGRLRISRDPKLWSASDSAAWLIDMAAQYHLPQVPMEKFGVDGATLCAMNLGQFVQRFPNGGETVHAQLQIWNSANEYCTRQGTPNWTVATALVDDPVVGHSEEQQFVPLHPRSVIQRCRPAAENATCNYSLEQLSLQQYQADVFPAVIHTQQPATCGFGAMLASPRPRPAENELLVDEYCNDNAHDCETGPPGPMAVNSVSSGNSSNIHLWQFLRELLEEHEKYGQCLRWVDQQRGIFKIEDSHALARLWGKRKNRPAMNYDKLSRSLRQYYKKNILKKTTRSQRLVYQFLHPYHVC